MAQLTVVDAARAGVDLAGVAAAGGGDSFTNTGKELLIVKNGGASPINVTLATQATVDGQAVGDRVVAVGAGVEMAIGPFPRWQYNDASNLVQVTYSGVTSVTVKVIRVTAEAA